MTSGTETILLVGGSASPITGFWAPAIHLLTSDGEWAGTLAMPHTPTCEHSDNGAIDTHGWVCDGYTHDDPS